MSNSDLEFAKLCLGPGKAGEFSPDPEWSLIISTFSLSLEVKAILRRRQGWGEKVLKYMMSMFSEWIQNQTS